MEFGDQKKANLWPMTGNFADILEHYFSKEKEKEITFDLLFRIYSAIYIDLSINALSENLTSFANGYRFWNDELLTEKGELLTENSSDVDILNALIKILKDNKSKADVLVLQYIEKIKEGKSLLVGEVLKGFDDLKHSLMESIKINADLVHKDLQDIKIHLSIPKIFIDLIDAGQLDQEMSNGILKPIMIDGKYKPVSDTKDFMMWLYNNGYEDCLYFKFFQKFIYYIEKDDTIRQYLKPSNFGVKKKKT